MCRNSLFVKPILVSRLIFSIAILLILEIVRGDLIPKKWEQSIILPIPLLKMSASGVVSLISASKPRSESLYDAVKTCWYQGQLRDEEYCAKLAIRLVFRIALSGLQADSVGVLPIISMHHQVKRYVGNLE